jgi:DNA-binding IclR family transcriptional regulator
MEEQVVRYVENSLRDQEGTLVAGSPAPMVERTFRLLDLLSDNEEGLTFSDMARLLQMSKGGLHGLLKTLESIGAVEQEEKHRYVLGPRLYDLAQTYIHRAGLRHVAVPAMRRLVISTGETVCLGKVEQKGVRIIEYLVAEEEKAALHIAVWRGQRLPLLAGAYGYCIMASWPPIQRESFLQMHRLHRFTRHSLTDPQQYLARVGEVAGAGVSFDHGEYLDGVNAVAAPIYSFDGALVALLWVFGFASRWSGEALDQAAQQVRAEAVSISTFLGYDAMQDDNHS